LKELTGKIVWIDVLNPGQHFEGQRQNIIGSPVIWKTRNRTQNAKNKDLESTP
jgi:hypothetical protein